MCLVSRTPRFFLERRKDRVRSVKYRTKERNQMSSVKTNSNPAGDTAPPQLAGETQCTRLLLDEIFVSGIQTRRFAFTLPDLRYVPESSLERDRLPLDVRPDL